jgi:hypothetical protein
LRWLLSQIDETEEQTSQATMSMFVVKRSGKKESVHFDKITSRVSKLCYGLDAKVCVVPMYAVLVLVLVLFHSTQ